MHTIDETTVHAQITVGKDVQICGYTEGVTVPVYRAFHYVTESQARAFMITPWQFAHTVTVYTGRETIVGDHVFRGQQLDHMDGILLGLMRTEGLMSVEVEDFWPSDWEMELSPRV